MLFRCHPVQRDVQLAQNVALIGVSRDMVISSKGAGGLRINIRSTPTMKVRQNRFEFGRRLDCDRYSHRCRHRLEAALFVLLALGDFARSHESFEGPTRGGINGDVEANDAGRSKRRKLSQIRLETCGIA
ncbi:hypothetical protein KC324_g61 [Hortaea werneckii]|nr:hypothetical protein KC324_g61 [Hortaea werneckii]